MSDLNEQFIRLVTANEAAIRRYAMSLLDDWNDAEDIVQNATVAMWKKFSEYDPEQPFANWACRFAYYEVLRHRRAKRRRGFTDATIELLAEQLPPENTLIESRRAALRTCLTKLSEDDRELIELRYATSRKLNEVAEEIDVAVDRLYRQLATIRRKLLACIETTIANA